MMPPAVMMPSASTPSVMMATPAPAHMTVAVTVTVAAFDLDDPSVDAAQSSRCSRGHCRGRQIWSQRKSAGGKSD
jgi:hypothetical protein